MIRIRMQVCCQFFFVRSGPGIGAWDWGLGLGPGIGDCDWGLGLGTGIGDGDGDGDELGWIGMGMGESNMIKEKVINNP